MFDKKQKLNVIPIVKDEMFIANQIDLRFFPDLFKIEFKQLNQQIDRIGPERNNSIIINRRTIALTPLVMKQFVGIINRMLANYEKQYGLIKMPKVPKKHKAIVKKAGSTGYIG